LIIKKRAKNFDKNTTQEITHLTFLIFQVKLKQIYFRIEQEENLWLSNVI